MSAIINSGENLMLERQASVAQTKTQGGRRLAQKRGPLLYNLEVQVPAKELNGTEYFAIENEVVTLEYGQNTFQAAGVSGLIGGNMTSQRGAWSGSPVISGASQTGTSLTISTGETSVTGYARAFDYVQFNGSTKVYQLMDDADTDSSGITTLTLNSPITRSPLNGTSVIFGLNVNFNFALIERPSTSYQPGSIVQYGSFKFEEVIQDTTRTGGLLGSNPPGSNIQSTTLFGTQSAADSAGAVAVVAYSLSSEEDSGEARIRLSGTDASVNDVIIAGSGSVSVTETGDTITITATDEVGLDTALALAIALG